MSINGLRNCPFSRRGIKLTREIYGKNEASLHGKTVRHQPDAVKSEIAELPPYIMEYYRDAELCVDVMHVNGIPFLVSILKNTHYGTVDDLKSMTADSLEGSIRNIIRNCSIRRFHISMIHVNNQFKCLKTRNKLGRNINVVSMGEHVPDVERFNRVIKERARCYYSEIAYKSLPRMMTKKLMKTIVFYINAFVWKDGASQHLPPVSIVEGLVLDYNKHFHVVFGTCCHTFEGTSNDMQKRTVGAVALGPLENLQGGMKLMSLVSGSGINRIKADVTELKTPEDAKRRITYLVKRGKGVRGLEFRDRHDNVDTVNTIVLEETENPMNDIARDTDDDVGPLEGEDNECLVESEPETPLGHDMEDDIAEDDANLTGVDDGNEMELKDVQPEECATRYGRKVKPKDLFRVSHYADDAAIKDLGSGLGTEEVIQFDQDEFQLCTDTLKWLDVSQTEIIRVWPVHSTLRW